MAAPAVTRAASNEVTPEVIQQVLERLQQDESQIKDLKAQLANRPPATAATPNSAAPAPDTELRKRLESDESALKDLRLELDGKNAADQKPKFPNLQFHGFGDVNFAADTRKGCLSQPSKWLSTL